jgi:hemolysin activation/secretion protein
MRRAERALRRGSGGGRPALALAAALAPLAAAAQTLPDLGFERRVAPSLEPLEPRPDAREPPALEVPAPAPGVVPRPVPGTEAGAPRVRIERIVLRGNTVLDPSDLRALVAPFEGESLALVDLLALRDALTRAYVDAGYVTSGAVIPQQDVADGTLVIELIEGELESIDVDGVERLGEGYVRRRLARAIGSPLAVDDVRAGLERLLSDPAIARLDARLGPGTERGRAILEVDVDEAPPVDARLLLANDRSPSVGGTRLSALVVAPNTLGFGDETRVELTALEGGPEAALSYSVPLTASDLRAFASIATYKLDVVEEPLDELDIEAENTSVAVGLRQPLIDTADLRVDVAASVDRQFTQTSLEGQGFSFAPGAEEGETVVTALRFTPTAEWRTPERALVGRATLSFGVDALDATISGPGTPDGQFVSLFAQGLWAERLNVEGRRLIAQANLQLATDALLPIEQLAIGGSDTVRGYRTNTLVRDAGWTASLEFREPLGTFRVVPTGEDPSVGALEALVFTDHGGGWNLRRPTPTPQTIHSVGAGLRWQPLGGVELGLDVGVPLRDTRRDDADTLQDLGIHFRVVLRPF